MSIFAVFDDVSVSVMQLNNDLLKISKWAVRSVPVKRCSRNVGIHLDEKLNFNHHVKEKITRANKGIGVIKKLSNTLPRNALLLQIICKTTFRLW